MPSERASKSAQKRAAQRVRSMIEELLGLSSAVVREIVTDDAVYRALEDARTMSSHGALRRQKQYAARLLRDSGAEQIQAALAARQSDSLSDRRRFHRAEQLRDTLVKHAGSGAQTALETAGLPATDALTAAMTSMVDARSDKAQKTAARQLFRIVMQHLEMEDTP
ncbi:MAG: ribosome biogenesis factor YjgA [Pseudomonadota bacterium]